MLKPFKRNTSCQTYIIAEAGVHHGCSIKKACELIDAAAAAGADAIKFQTYKSKTLVSRWAPTYWQPADSKEPTTQYEYFRQRDRFDQADYHLLNEYADKKNIVFCSTPFDLQAVQWLNEIDVPFWKIASGDITNFPLLAAVAVTGKPVILSTGASYYNEIEEAVYFIRTKGCEKIALLHCNLAYPSADRDANLGRISELQNRFPDTVVGYSDHTIPDDSIIIPVLAVALGARIIEKHFTLDRSLPGDDHGHSMEPALLRTMINSIRKAELATPDAQEITESEMPARKNARRSLVARQPIAAGTLLTEDMLEARRPGGGIPPSALDDILGKKTGRNIEEDTQIQLEHLE